MERKDRCNWVNRVELVGVKDRWRSEWLCPSVKKQVLLRVERCSREGEGDPWGREELDEKKIYTRGDFQKLNKKKKPQRTRLLKRREWSWLGGRITYTWRNWSSEIINKPGNRTQIICELFLCNAKVTVAELKNNAIWLQRTLSHTFKKNECLHNVFIASY